MIDYQRNNWFSNNSMLYIQQNRFFRWLNRCI